MQFILSPVRPEEDQQLIQFLEDLGKLQFEYPTGLFVVRRADFISKVEQWEKARSSHQLHSQKGVI